MKHINLSLISHIEEPYLILVRENDFTIIEEVKLPLFSEDKTYNEDLLNFFDILDFEDKLLDISDSNGGKIKIVSSDNFYKCEKEFDEVESSQFNSIVQKFELNLNKI